jgi:hypothetical protein
MSSQDHQFHLPRVYELQEKETKHFKVRSLLYPFRLLFS